MMGEEARKRREEGASLQINNVVHEAIHCTEFTH